MQLSRRAFGATAAGLSLTPLIAQMAAARGQGGTFVFGGSGDPVKLDPAVITDGNSARITEQIFDTLVMFDGGTTNIKPALAEGWDISEDGLTWTFYIRQGVIFHDGTELNAEAVRINFDRWMNPESPYHTKGAFEYFDDVAGFGEVIDSVNVIDDFTIQIQLKEPQGPFLINLALFAFAIVSPRAMASDFENLHRNPVGTSAFRFVEWVPDSHVTLERNDKFWGQKALVDRVIVRTIKDNAARFLELLAGTIDMMEFINPDDLRRARGDRRLQIYVRPSLNIAYLDMNQTSKPFSDLRVRRAVAHAIDKAGIVEALYAGSGVPATQFIPPTLVGYNTTIRHHTHDPNLARQLLAGAGFPNGLSTELWYMPVSRPYYPDPKSIAEAYAADLAKVGIRVTLKTEDWGQYLTNSRQRKYPMWMLGWTGDNGDTDNFLFTFFGQFKERNTWDNAKVRDLLVKAQRISDVLEREALYFEANAIIHEEVPKVAIAHTTPPLPARGYVRGYVTNPTATEFYNTLWLDK